MFCTAFRTHLDFLVDSTLRRLSSTVSSCQPQINLVQGTKIPKLCDLVVAEKPSRTSALLWRIGCGRYGRLSGCCAHCLSAAKGASTSFGVLSHLNALRQILFLAEGVVPHSARPSSTGLPTIRHSVKFPERLAGDAGEEEAQADN